MQNSNKKRNEINQETPFTDASTDPVLATAEIRCGWCKVSPGRKSQVGESMGEKTSQANLCLCDGLAVVAVGRHCRFGTCADRQSSNSRHECHRQYGTALHRLSCHSSQQERASAETVGTDFPRAGCPGGTGFHDCYSAQVPCGLDAHYPKLRATGAYCQIPKKQ